MKDLIEFIQNAPISTILVISGIVFLFLAAGGHFGGKNIVTNNIRSGSAGITGVLLLIFGSILFFVPTGETPLEKPPSDQVTPRNDADVQNGEADVATFTHTDRSPLSDPQVNEAIRTKAMVEARKAVQQEAAKWIIKHLEKLGLARRSGVNASDLALALLEVTITQRDAESDQGESLVETVAIGKLDLKTLDQRLSMPVLDDLMKARLDELLKREEELLNRVEKLEKANEQLKPQLAELTPAQQQEETTKIARASEQVSDELKATELYRQALIQQGLGRYDVSDRLLTQAIDLAPDYEEARLARNWIEDAEYLVENQTTVSPEPYFVLAKHHLYNGQVDEATQLLKKATSLFPNRGVMIVELVYDSSEIDINTIIDSLTLEGLPQGWNQPPGLVRNSLTIVGNSIFVHGRSGLDLQQNAAHWLKFARYGFEPVSIEAESDEFRPGTILQRTMFVQAKEIAAKNTIRGRVVMVGQQDHSGITAAIYDNWYENIGFRKEGVSDKQGYFSISEVPDGRFELELKTPGYVDRTISIEIKQNVITCNIDAKGESAKPGRTPCDLTEIGLSLHRIKNIELKWMLQEDPTQFNFRGQISEGEVTLDAGLKYDWSRGGWGCCQSSYKFGTRQIDGPSTDLVIYTALDGRIFFAQPHAPFIAQVREDYDDLTDVDEQIDFKKTEEVIEGRTYVMTTSASGGSADSSDRIKFLVKLKVMSIK